MTSLSLSTLTMRGPSVHTTTSSYILITKKSVPGRGYCPEPSKSVLIVHPDNPETINGLDCVTGLSFALACIILAVLSGITGPNVIGCRIVH